MSDQNNHRERVVAIISTYQPSAELLQHCAQLAPQVSKIIVVDDGSDERAHSTLTQLTEHDVLVERMGENRGIGAAINTGVDRARELKPEFVVTFDQDSEVPEGFVDSLVTEYDRLVTLRHRVGMVAPEYFSSTPQTRIAQTHDFLEAYAPIQSGLLMPLSAIDELGPQRADYFIDLIDTEYYFRAHRAGFVAACVPGLSLPHGFGNRLFVHAFGRQLHKKNGRPRMVAVSTPFRYYYRVRNRILLNREYAGTAEYRKQLRRDSRADFFLDFGVALYSAKGKFSLLRLMWSGSRDGIRGRTGKMSPHLAQLASRVSWRHPAEESQP